MKKNVYRYLRVDPATDEVQGPLASCPECGHDLTGEGGVEIELTDGRHGWTQDTRLLGDGTLDDPRGTVAKGLLGAALCGGCGEELAGMDLVAEEEQEGEGGTPDAAAEGRLTLRCPCCGEGIAVALTFSRAVRDG